jgi:hypothetical protein
MNPLSEKHGLNESSSAPLVSVIMPTYNAEKWVSRAIDNLIAQTYPHLELIIVDDASQDGTVQVTRDKLKKDFRRDWKIIELGRNGGPSAARNVGIKAATGSWVQFLDSDDLLAANKIELQMAICAGALSDVSAVYSPWRFFYLDGEKITWEGPIVQTDMEGKAPIMCLVGGDRYLHNAGLTRRSVLEQIGGFDEALRFWECEEINVRVARTGRLLRVHSDEPLYLWRMHREKSYLGGDKARYGMAANALSWIELMWEAGGHRTLEQLGLRPVDRKQIIGGCTMWARRLYAQDRAAFHKFVAMARKLEPGISPAYPKYASLISRFAGYETAEAVARLGAMPKNLARWGLRKMRPRKGSIFD